jgi:hypothetical protein
VDEIDLRENINFSCRPNKILIKIYFQQPTTTDGQHEETTLNTALDGIIAELLVTLKQPLSQTKLKFGIYVKGEVSSHFFIT